MKQMAQIPGPQCAFIIDESREGAEVKLRKFLMDEGYGVPDVAIVLEPCKRDGWECWLATATFRMN